MQLGMLFPQDENPDKAEDVLYSMMRSMANRIDVIENLNHFMNKEIKRLNELLSIIQKRASFSGDDNQYIIFQSVCSYNKEEYRDYQLIKDCFFPFESDTGEQEEQ